jgi:hypothetical protein
MKKLKVIANIKAVVAAENQAATNHMLVSGLTVSICLKKTCTDSNTKKGNLSTL